MTIRSELEFSRDDRLPPALENLNKATESTDWPSIPKLGRDNYPIIGCYFNCALGCGQGWISALRLGSVCVYAQADMRLLNQLAQSRPDVDLSCVAVFLILVVQDFPL
jgi:hypothetical protein